MGMRNPLHFLICCTQQLLLTVLCCSVDLLFSLSRANLVPVFSFGENDLFNQVSNPRGSQLRAFQTKLMKVFSFAPPLFFGRGISPKLIGFTPHRKPICTVGKRENNHFLVFQIKLKIDICQSDVPPLKADH